MSTMAPPSYPEAVPSEAIHTEETSKAIMTADPKIIDLIKARNGESFTSLEFFPPRTEEGVKVRIVATFLCDQSFAAPPVSVDDALT